MQLHIVGIAYLPDALSKLDPRRAIDIDTAIYGAGWMPQKV